MRNPSIMHDFSRIPGPNIQRSTFDLSSGHKTTFNAGDLIPFFHEEVLPGDTFNLRAHIVARFATLEFPIMDNVWVETFFFFVPNRLLWDNWERMNGAQDDPTDSIDFQVPVLDDDNMIFAEGSIFDYFGLPTEVEWAGGTGPMALPLRAYNLICKEWFRDQNLQDSPPILTDDGPDTPNNYGIIKRCKKHDYFTSALPWPQKGDAVEMPLGDTAPVEVFGSGLSIGLSNVSGDFGMATQNGVAGAEFRPGAFNVAVGTNAPAGNPTGQRSVGLSTDPDTSGIIGLADLSSATAATINQLRQAFAFQSILELDARGGTRYTEILRAHFGVVSPDFRLQRPEYLGGGRQRLAVHQVAQTSESAADPLGKLAAFATAEQSSGFFKSFVEHGQVIGIINARADINYQEGLDRKWSRRTRYDYYLPALAHLGEQAVLSKEIVYPSLGVGAETVWGYQERWAEYRMRRSYVSGQLRSNAAQTLDAWHLALDFNGVAPTLNDVFIEDQPPVARVIAVTTAPHFIMDAYFDFKATRPMPTYSVPGLMGRF